MKIAVITDHIPSKWAHSINTMKMAQGFFKLGHKVEVLVIQRYKEAKNKLKIKDVHNFYGVNKKVKIKYFRDYSPYYFREIRYLGGFLVEAANFLTRFLYPLKIFFDPEKKISYYCKKEKFDLAFCRRAYKTVYYNTFNKISTILDVHDYRNAELNDIVKLNNNVYFKGIMTINNVIKEKLIKFGFAREKFAVMDNAVELNKFNQITDNKLELRKKLNLPLNRRIILYSGALYNNRGIDSILNASNLLKHKDISFFFIGGDTKSIKRWKKFISKNSILANISFLGWKERNLVPLYLKASDILLATYSVNCPTLDIMSPVKLIEYMASKTPSIVTKIGRNIELCEDYTNCLFTKPDDPRDLSEKIEILLLNDELKNKLITNAYAKAKNYTFEKRCQKILELL
ncbi:MAG: glycosyltransferase [Promethearchaeota archaeon]